jgi:hypothetical protein
MSTNPMFHLRKKHIEMDFYFVYDKVASKQLIVKFISSNDQLANPFTKTLLAP